MATINGLTAERMLEIEAASIVDGDVIADHLILTRHDGTPIDAGSVVGPAGPAGPMGSGLSVLSASGILEPGITNQRRAGRILTVADFTTLLGLSTPVGLFNLGSLANLGSGGALVNKGSVTFDKGITGAAGEAAKFSGSTAQALYIVDTGAADPFRIKYGSWGCWFKTAKRGIYQGLMSKWTAAASHFLLEISSSNFIYARAYAGTSAAQQGYTDVCDDRWHHVVITWDGVTLMAYLDGAVEFMFVTPGQIGPMTVGAAPFNIGGASADSGTITADPSYARIDEAFVTADVLTEDQVRLLYSTKIAHGAGFTPTSVDLMIRRLRKGAALVSGDFATQPLHLYNFTAGSLSDIGSLNNALALTGAPDTAPAPDGLKDNAYVLKSAANQYLSATDAGLPIGTSVKSCGVWFKSFDTGNGGLVIWGNQSYGLWYGGGAIAGGDWTFGGIGSSVLFNDGQWHFAVLVYDNAAVDGLKRKVYVDGKLVGSDVNAGTTITGVGANGFQVGHGAMGYFNGALSRPFVTNYALTAEEIAALYAKGSLSLGASPKNEGDHVERVDATNIYLICDNIESQHQIDLLVAS